MTMGTASPHSPRYAKRTPVRPKHSASAVIALGAKARSGIPPMRRPGSPGEGAAGSAILLPDAVDDPALADTRDDRFARQRALPQQHLRRRSRGQIDVDPAAETDQPDALPGFERAAHADRKSTRLN